ncbi:hypothetical protein [Rickettsia australis]|uniref:Uncharacterized protein n=1 Tax=Rickettsia australis (strain Cutlack) TaxID=1105110 RepID=H8K9P4_RICAC|nr:hypothetical protein [Rickettsia australis]AFC70764.1 hypothetical protein MC5_01860 [Rickettsia australis str. Cutlack]
MKKGYFGIIAEYIYIIIYKLKFYQILHHRKRYYVGEIDSYVIKKLFLLQSKQEALKLMIDLYLAISQEELLGLLKCF